MHVHRTKKPSKPIGKVVRVVVYRETFTGRIAATYHNKSLCFALVRTPSFPRMSTADVSIEMTGGGLRRYTMRRGPVYGTMSESHSCHD